MKNFFLGMVSIAVAICFLVAGGEIAIRGFHLYTQHILNHKSFKTIALDEEFGWLPVPNYRYSGELLDAAGKNYSVEIQTDDAGFRMFGNPLEKSRKRVLFLGDSFTHAMHVSNEKTYYGLLKKSLDLEVFSLGVEGYGTLQEYMLLDKFLDEISPDIVVLQFCENDFINNSYDLELRSGTNNNGFRRPYFKNNEVYYKVPSSYPAIHQFAANHSQFLYFIFIRIDRLRAPLPNSAESAEGIISKQGMSYPLFRDSVEITEQLMRKIRKRVPEHIPILLFSTQNIFPYHDELKRLSEKNDIRFTDQPSVALRAAERKGITTTAQDGAHWNNAGHQIVADVLKRYFLENF
jgi:lysophospholipase L1-like esterase